MKRKIVQHGPSSLIISLPSLWAKQNNVKKGDDIDVREEGNTLIIGVDNRARNYSMTNDVSALKPYLVKQFLGRAYQKGYDNIHIIHNSEELLAAIKEKTQELIGFEIVEQNNSYCVIQSLTSNIELDFDNSLRKGFLIVKQMLEACVESYEKTNLAALEDLHLKNIEAKRFCFFCLRQINKSQYITSEIVQQSHLLFYLIGVLGELGDSIKALSEYLAKTTKKKPAIHTLLKMLLEQYSVSYSYFYKANVEKANGAYGMYTDINDKILKIIETGMEGVELLIIFKIKDASHLTHHFTAMRLDFLKEHEKDKQLV